ncbi:aspartate aminotransferase family protein [Actinoplanes hulinensis]|uniref:Aspartate aminotransferase family protein n=1 Tax=Actinoplanes hulinensis TaxID=1144547 RepID=A0ABS7B5T5_9ACTN|nr:aspartate aminotransferase family protein [Actinoplanes hulinensis]MBW6436408.1 aspartate aminotransferase family protein [Actinoplanes hulinensis]
MADNSRGVSRFGRTADRPRGAEHWAAEQEVIGPGLQAVMLWAQLCVESAAGAVLIDVDGNEIIDFQGAGGVNSIGHANPRLIEALTAEMSTAPAGGFGSAGRRAMADSLREFLPPPLDRIQLYSGGTEAVEAALRLAKSVTGKHEFLSFWGGFHGKTLGSLGLTAGARGGLGPLPSGYFSAPYANCYHCPLKTTFPGCGYACVDTVRDTIKENSTGALAALVVEPVQGRSGNVVPPPGYLNALSEVAREFDALLIVDEMMTGFGRTGEPFAFMRDEVVPDIITVGKGMGAGYPVTGVISTAELMAAAPFSDPSASSSSFGAFPLACRAVATTTDVIVDEDLPTRAAKLGGEMLAALRPLVEESPLVGDVRGAGFAIGIELVADKETRRPLDKATFRETFLALADAGVLVMTGGTTLRLYPPLNVDADLAEEAVQIIRRVLIDGVAPRPAVAGEEVA